MEISNNIAKFSKEWLEMKRYKEKDLETLRQNNASDNVADYFDYISSLYPTNTAILSIEQPSRSFTYSHLNSLANQIARWGKDVLGLQQTETVALIMENRVDYPVVTLGMAKIGVTTALINYNLTGKLLYHALKVARAKHVILTLDHLENCVNVSSLFDTHAMNIHIIVSSTEKEQVLNDYESILSNLGSSCSILDIDNLPYSKDHIDKSHRNLISDRHPYVYIYTSGTTGPSKAAIFSHRRYIGCGLTWSRPSLISSETSYYIPLPLYHGNAGAVALSPLFLKGGKAVLKRKFSVSLFWKDIDEWGCTLMIYVGELWRYICSLQETPSDTLHSLKVVVGNGLRKEIWGTVVKRFGIQRVVEHYGSTEMPGDAILQWFGKEGSCGFVPRELMHMYSGVIIKYDTMNGKPLILDTSSNDKPWGVKCVANEPGELIMPLPDGKYDGYVDSLQTEKKLYRDVFEKGDLWFSTDEDGFYYFVDRTGDTFRWKGENVATTEVEKVLSEFKGVAEANEVYGVSVVGYDGKAGMAALYMPSDGSATLSRYPDFGLEMGKYVSENLPHFARPLFLRIRKKEMEKTSTIKFQKHVYSKDGFDLAVVTDDEMFVYDRSSETYLIFTESIRDSILSGKYRL